MTGSTSTTKASEAEAPRGRSWAAVATSASLHVAAIALLAALARVAPAPTLPHERRPVTFVMMRPPAPLEMPHDPPPSLTLPVAATPERPIPIVVPAPDAPPVAPKPLARSEPGPAPPEPVRSAPPTIAAPVPVRTPPVAVGLFADSTPTVHEAKPAEVVRAAGFDAPSPIAKSGETKSAAAVGAFDQSMAGAPGRVARAGAPVTSAGFGSSRAATSGDIKPPAEVRPSGFDAVRPTPAPALRATPPERVDVPVEILFKPVPTYTDEARALKLEGDVVLSVEFGATGALTVLQVVRGLGHGLDEAAARAAAQIRFKPAQSAGRPINFRTTVHIVFRLA
jgi:TonB family protein